MSEPTAPPSNKNSAFFKQSGWLMIANIGAGMFALGVHFLNKKISAEEYSTFVTLLMVTVIVPTIPLQMVLAQQSAKALAEERRGELAGVIKLAWLLTTVVWLIGAIVVFLMQDQIVHSWKLPNASGLWMTMLVVLASLWMPVFNGALQGKQDFLAMGWAALGGGIGRMAVASILVIGFGGASTAMIAGAFVGISIMAVVPMWRTRDLWLRPSEPFDKRSFLGQVIPLMLGFAAMQFLFSSDTLFASSFFTREEMKPYGVAGTLSRALLWLVLPLAAVMFPKLVHANAKSEKSNLFLLVLAGTGLLTVCGAAGLWLVGPIAVKIIFKEGDVAAAVHLLPWYAFAMVPLAMANVLVNDLMARAKFVAVPFMVATAVGYAFALPWAVHHWPGRMEVVMQTLGVFNLLLLAVCGVFAVGQKSKHPPLA